MQKNNLKFIKRDLDSAIEKVKKQNTYIGILAFSNLALWLVIILNYFLQG